MIEPKEFLKAAQHLHGHKCPAMHMGLRAGAAAMNALGAPRARDVELLAILELGEDHCSHCFADGVQMITGCTYGKGNLRALPYGKFGVTLVLQATGRAVRVVPRAEAQASMKASPYFLEYKAKRIAASRVPDEVVDPVIERVMTAPQDRLLTVGPEFKAAIEKKEEALASVVCARCGEMVVEKYARVHGDDTLCIPCQASLA